MNTADSQARRAPGDILAPHTKRAIGGVAKRVAKVRDSVRPAPDGGGPRIPRISGNRRLWASVEGCEGGMTRRGSGVRIPYGPHVEVPHGTLASAGVPSFSASSPRLPPARRRFGKDIWAWAEAESTPALSIAQMESGFTSAIESSLGNVGPGSGRRKVQLEPDDLAVAGGVDAPS